MAARSRVSRPDTDNQGVAPQTASRTSSYQQGADVGLADASRLGHAPGCPPVAASTDAVRAVTDTSISTVEGAHAGRAALSGLPGFVRGDALASALLLAAAPDRMAIYDRRAHAGLHRLGLRLSNARGR